MHDVLFVQESHAVCNIESGLQTLIPAEYTERKSWPPFRDVIQRATSTVLDHNGVWQRINGSLNDSNKVRVLLNMADLGFPFNHLGRHQCTIFSHSRTAVLDIHNLHSHGGVRIIIVARSPGPFVDLGKSARANELQGINGQAFLDEELLYVPDISRLQQLLLARFRRLPSPDEAHLFPLVRQAFLLQLPLLPLFFAVLVAGHLISLKRVACLTVVAITACVRVHSGG
mmetsp:Transcript_16585/g.37864  ORF Transcript_16585/g.37864 Transcript_16585/m.37864 type:complete len:228 (-) Transcript_16585:144-827(-)